MSQPDSILQEFVVESHENLDQLDRDLVVLEQDPQDRERLGSIFRTIHTIKGTCGFFGYGKLEAVTHVGENLLSRLRDGVLHLNPEITSALLALVDAVREILAVIETTGSEGDGDYRSLIDTLTRLQEPEPANPVVQPEPPEVKAAPEPAAPGMSEGSVRVDVGLLDQLMNLVGELVLARNQVLQFAASQEEPAFLNTSQRLNLITTELQEGVMKTRMQPIGNVWNRFPRTVRDLARACGKRVRIEMEGQGTELDRTIIEAIKDPLTHLVRNAVDHGVELPEVRQARGKPAEGRLFLRAFHEGGQVNIEVSDDGAGIDPERIRQKAVARGLITRDQAERLSERECLRLIFLPGFSTSETVTNLSGRGVGMDVVRTNIEKIGGTVDVQSHPGRGTAIKIKIPLTLAIIPALIVTSGGDRYAIPQVSLVELVRLEADHVRQAVEQVHSAPVYRLRGNLLPLVYLEQLLGPGAGAAADAEGVNVVVLQADDRQFGLVVAGINDTEEIVVKPLSQQLKGISLFAGATILGDGRVALILDILGIAQRAGVVSEVHDRALAEAAPEAAERVDDRQTLLLLEAGRDSRLAIPLSLVARLEEIPAADVERADGREVVQYRNQILPLVRLAELLGRVAEERLAEASLQVVVYSEQDRSVGLVVDRILDIIETPLDIQRTSLRSGLVSSVVIQERVTDLLDISGLLRAADPDLLEPAAVCVS